MPILKEHQTPVPGFSESKVANLVQRAEKVFGIVVRYKRVFFISIPLAFGLGLLYLMLAVPKYTSSVSILIDSRRNQDQITASIADQAYDTSAIDSQVEVINSDKVAGIVVRSLSLDTNPAFTNEGGVIRSVAKAVVGAVDIRKYFVSPEMADAGAVEARRLAAIQALETMVTVKRVSRTYVLTISIRHANPDLAMKIANAYADAYFTDQMEARYEVTRRASGWLQERIAELKENSIAADLAVQRYKAEQGIVTTTTNMSGPSFLADQQISELTSQMSTAHGETLKAKARVEQIERILQSGSMESTVADVLGSAVITDLRSKYLKASKTASELEARLGPNHYQVQSLHNEMAQYDRLIYEELQRIGETYKSDAQVAEAKEKSLAETMSGLIGNQTVTNSSRVQLRELERESEAYKTLYTSFLQRYQDSLQRQSFPTSEARVISPAVRPDRPSSPKTTLVLLGSLFLGILGGGATVVVREMRDRGFRGGSQVREELGLHFLGLVPAVANNPLPQTASPTSRQVEPATASLRMVIDEPLSQFSEILRCAKVEADMVLGHRPRAKVIGIVSVLPGEGKTTLSKNFASFLAILGTKTLLIDGDARNPQSSRSLVPGAARGLFEMIRGEAKFEDVVCSEKESGLDFLPIASKKRLSQNADLWMSGGMDVVLEQLSGKYNYIVVDLPPIGAVSDARAANQVIDAYLFVVEWGKTNRDVVRTVLETNPALYDKCFGVVLNKVDLEQIQLYGHHDETYYYSGRYGRYYRQEPSES